MISKIIVNLRLITAAFATYAFITINRQSIYFNHYKHLTT